jgi:hypothetical protein
MLDKTFYITRVNSFTRPSRQPPASRPRVPSRRRPRAGEAPPCPSLHRLPCAGDVAAVGHTCRAHCVVRARAGPSWARPWAAHAAQAEAKPGQAGPRALRKPTAPTLCYWAAGGFNPVAFDLNF